MTLFIIKAPKGNINTQYELKCTWEVGENVEKKEKKRILKMFVWPIAVNF